MKIKMIFAFIFLAACAVCFSPIETFAQDAKPAAVKRSRSFINGSYAYKFTEDDFAGVPLWNQTDSEPPLSIGRAIKTARENLPRFVSVKNADDWKINVVMLENMGDNIWYYRVHLYCAGASCRDIEDRSFMAFIKLDGSLIEPKKVTIEK